VIAGRDVPSPAWPGSARDISRNGISVLVGYPFEPGTLLSIELRGGPAGAPAALQARVVHAQGQAEGKWLLGCSLVRELDDRELEALRARAGRSSTIFRRAWVRVPSGGPAAPDERWSAKVFNVSASGIALAVPRAFGRGALLSIELHARAGKPAYTVLVRVVHATAQPDGEWALGCAFASEPGEGEQKVLLS
jgi:hypothetical protein